MAAKVIGQALNHVKGAKYAFDSVSNWNPPALTNSSTTGPLNSTDVTARSRRCHDDRLPGKNLGLVAMSKDFQRTVQASDLSAPDPAVSPTIKATWRELPVAR